MNIPAGTKIAYNMKTNELNAQKMIGDLQKKQFSGYITITVKEKFGFEDGIIVIKKGLISGSYYNIISVNHDIYSKDALSLIGNAFGSSSGAVDIYQLSNEQVDLMLTFNEKIRIDNSDGFYQLIAQKYDFTKVQKYLKNDKESSKYDLLKKIGLEGLKV